METVLECTDFDELENAACSTAVIPSGNDVDITIKVALWWLLAQGNTLAKIAYNYDWAGQLEDCGLTVNSIDTSVFSTSITFHCTANENVCVSDITTGGTSTSKIVEAGLVNSKVIVKALSAAMVIFGFTATAITLIKISADLTTNITTLSDLTTYLVDNGYTADEISEILHGVTSSASGDSIWDTLGIPTWALIAAGVLFGLYIFKDKIRGK